MREVATKRGQRAEVYLSDGTRVLIAPASTIRFAATFGENRDVYLDGQAFFQVAHNDKKPFRVHTTAAVVEDVGTTFSVRQFAGDTSVRIIIGEGIVKVRDVVAGAGDLLDVQRDRPIRRERVPDLDKSLAWTRGQLVFEAVPFSEAIPELSRWFDLDLLLARPDLGARRLTASISDEPTAEVMRMLALALDARYSMHGRSVTFYPQGKGQ